MHRNLIGDNAYDSDELDGELRQYGIELTAAPPYQSKKYDPRPTSHAAVSAPLEDREALRVATQLTPASRATRTLCRELWDAIPRLLVIVEAFMMMACSLMASADAQILSQTDCPLFQLPVMLFAESET
jgi:hypothetical protein